LAVGCTKQTVLTGSPKAERLFSEFLHSKQVSNSLVEANTSISYSKNTDSYQEEPQNIEQKRSTDQLQKTNCCSDPHCKKVLDYEDQIQTSPVWQTPSLHVCINTQQM